MHDGNRDRVRKLLRDLRSTTKLLILLELSGTPAPGSSLLAERLGMTLQGLSEYERIMSGEELLVKAESGYRPTHRGVAWLHDTIRELKWFVDESMSSLDVIQSCSALAGDRIGEGERVELHMEGGRLVAYPLGKDASSTGTAVHDAIPGGPMQVEELRGILDYRIGLITFIPVPEGGAVPADTILPELPGDARIAALGPEAISLVEGLGRKVDLEFDPVNAAIDAATRGVDVVFFMTEREMGAARHRISDAPTHITCKVNGKLLHGHG